MCVKFLGRQYSCILIKPIMVDWPPPKDADIVFEDPADRDVSIEMDENRAFLRVAGVAYPMRDRRYMLNMPLASIRAVMVSIDELKEEDGYPE